MPFATLLLGYSSSHFVGYAGMGRSDQGFVVFDFREALEFGHECAEVPIHLWERDQGLAGFFIVLVSL